MTAGHRLQWATLYGVCVWWFGYLVMVTIRLISINFNSTLQRVSFDGQNFVIMLTIGLIRIHLFWILYIVASILSFCQIKYLSYFKKTIWRLICRLFVYHYFQPCNFSFCSSLLTPLTFYYCIISSVLFSKFARPL